MVGTDFVKPVLLHAGWNSVLRTSPFDVILLYWITTEFRSSFHVLYPSIVPTKNYEIVMHPCLWIITDLICSTCICGCLLKCILYPVELFESGYLTNKNISKHSARILRILLETQFLVLEHSLNFMSKTITDYALTSKAFWYGIFHIQFGDPVKRILVGLY